MNKQFKEMEVVFVGGELNGVKMLNTQIPSELIVGYSMDNTEARNQGGTCGREELDNQPIVKGYLSAAYDGGKLRYETQEVYNYFFD